MSLRLTGDSKLTVGSDVSVWLSVSVVAHSLYKVCLFSCSVPARKFSSLPATPEVVENRWALDT